ncbi:MAG: hypothetical protein V1787_06285 [Candidatus Micrarchaeota archaeon]
MRKALALLLLLPFVALASADCKSFVKDGYPLGIRPYSPNLTVSVDDSEGASEPFKVYIEGDATSGNLAGCTVLFSVVDVNGTGADLSFVPASAETGLGWKDAEAFLKAVPTPPYDDVSATIRITDADNPNVFSSMRLWVNVRFRPPLESTATPPPVVTPPVTPPQVVTPTPPPVNAFPDIAKELENDSSKYVVAIIAVFFLGALLWLGMRTLSRD